MGDKDKQIMSLQNELGKCKARIEQLNQQLNEFNHRRMTIFSNFSHEIRTPLNGIMGFAENLNTEELSKDDLVYYSGVIDESSKLLLAIINDVSDIARMEANLYKVYPVAFDINDLFFNIFMEFRPKAEEKNLQLFLENLISEEFIIQSDPDVIKRILSKLIENAIKFTKEGWVKLAYEVEKDKIVFSVEDSGIGIHETLKENLFHRFITEEVSKSRKIGGTGLDLSLCNGLVKLLGGEMWYKSEVGKGSKFYFSFQLDLNN